MKEIITIGESGWKFHRPELNELSDLTAPISWEMTDSFEDPKDSVLFESVDQNLLAQKPTIVVIDPDELRNGDAESKLSLHSVLALGLNSNKVVINDPWGTMFEVVDRDQFADAWDPVAKRIITTHIPPALRFDSTTTKETQS